MCELPVVLHKGHQTRTCVMDGTYAFLVWRAGNVKIFQVRLADALYRSDGVHDLVRQHPGQLLPRFHLAVCHLFLYVLPHVVQGFLQGFLSEEESACRQPEREVPVAYGIAHDLRPLPQQTLVPVSVSQRCNGKD